MNTRIAPRAAALALAAVVTFGVLFGLDGLAARERGASTAQLAQAQTTQPAATRVD